MPEELPVIESVLSEQIKSLERQAGQAEFVRK